MRLAVMGLPPNALPSKSPITPKASVKSPGWVSYIGKRLVALSELSAFALSPEAFSRQITLASETARSRIERLF